MARSAFPMSLRPTPPWIFNILILLGILFIPTAAYANLLGNHSFEEVIGGDTKQNWDDTNSAVRVSNATVTGLGFGTVPDGGFALRLDAAADFTFQVKDNVKPGDLVTLSAFGQSDVAAGSGGQLRIEFKRIRDPIRDTDELISATNDDVLVNTDTAPTSGAYVRFSVTARAPEGTQRIVFVLRGQGAFGAGNVILDNANGEINPGTLHVGSSKTNVKVGEPVAFQAEITNDSGDTLSAMELKVEVPPGFSVLPDSVRNDGASVNFREGSLIVSLGNMAAAQRNRITFFALATPGAVPGKIYEFVFQVIASGGHVSETRSVVIRVKGDPLFDEGTLLGKVFDDRNEDGVQNKGEIGVPRVRLYTEYGVSVLTDRDGRFHIPAVQPGRHVLKIDGHTLPRGTTFVTEESLLVKTTPGLLNKVRFAVHLPDSALPPEFTKDLQIWVTQGIDLARPQLEVTMEPEFLKVGLGRLEREPVFRIKNNYGEFLVGWQIQILDEMGEKVWTGFGLGQPPSRLPWKGLTDSGEVIRSGIYAYRLIVRDKEDRTDWTPLRFFRVIHKTQAGAISQETLNIPPSGAFNIFRDGKRSIPLVAQPTIRVYGKTRPDRSVQVNGIPVEVTSTGEFEQEMFVRPGPKVVTASAVSAEGETVSVEEKLEIKNSAFFLVALGEEELGVNILRGNFETVGRDDNFHEDFYEDGRLAYYLKAKLKGKFLVKSRYDTSDKRSELFTSLDPDEYYPVYGDYSQVEYEGQDTRERFYLVVEMDRSFLKYGSFQTDFTDTELGRHNRTLSGIKVHHESLASTKYGDSKRGFSVFWSSPEHLADHNEFRATGGSLYYLRNRNLLSGSEKIRVETRDKIQDIPLTSRDLVNSKDYEIDYRQGRVLLREPLSSVSASDTIISNDILDGNPVFLIVDYEFETFQEIDYKTAGIRGYTHVGDHFRIGGTAVEEKRPNTDYDLRAVDGVFKIGRRTKVTAEFAQAKLQSVSQALSFDGGLSFQSQTPLTGRRPREKAYLIKAESQPFEPLEVSGYLQDVEPGFSIDRIKSQEGFRKHGVQARLKFNEHFYLLGRQDSTELAAQLRPLTRAGITASIEKLRSTTVQAVFDYEAWNVIGEYLHQVLDVPIRNRIDTILSERPFDNAFGLRVAHRVSGWLTPYLKGQMSFSGKRNYQLGGGVEAKVGKRTQVRFEEMVGDIGDATTIGISTQQDDKTTSYASIKSQDDGFGSRRISTTAGSSHQLSERSRVYSEREYSSYSGTSLPSYGPMLLGGQSLTPGLWSSDIYGYETRFRERWDLNLRFERRHLDAGDFRSLADPAIDNLLRTNTFNTLAASLGYNDSKRWRWEDSFEVRIEPDAPGVRQWVSQNSAEWKVNQDLSFLGRANFGTSRFVEPGSLTGRFIELNTGFAYRPVESDRLNWLTRYTFLDEVASDAQFPIGTLLVDEQAHIFAVEGAYEMTRQLQMVEKLAYRFARYRTSATTDWLDLSSLLWVHRFNYHVTRKWDLALEYRMLFQWDAAESLRHGPLVEIDRELYNYVRLGIGYNFTDFDDDLRRVNDFRRNGFFVRLSGKV